MKGISWLLAFGLISLLVFGFSTVADENACCDKMDEMKNLVNDMKSKITQLNENKIDEPQLTRQLYEEEVCCDKIDEMKNIMNEIKSEIHQLYQDSRRTMALGGSYCPRGFVYLPEADSCYKVIHDAKRNWASASQKCQDLFYGAHLAVITSANETEAVNWLIRSEISNSKNMDCRTPAGNIFWIAGQRLDITTCNSRFVWKLPGTTQISMTYSNWGSGEPNCGYNNEHCAHIWPDRQYQWNDAQCHWEVCAICEYNYNA